MVPSRDGAGRLWTRAAVIRHDSRSDIVSTDQLLSAVREIVAPLAVRFDGQDRAIERIETRGVEFTALADDIRAQGLRETIKLFDGQILDGRNRFPACGIVGVAARFEPFDGDPLALVVSENLRRRHLNESQRAMVAARLASLPEGRPPLNSENKETAPIDAVYGVSQERAAEILNVGRSSVQRAREVLDDGAPELVSAVERGRLAVSAAANLAKKPPEFQAAVESGCQRRVRPDAELCHRRGQFQGP